MVIPHALWIALIPFALGASALIAAPAAQTDPAVQVLATKSGVRFGIWPARPAGPAPALFILANSIEETLGSPYYRQAGQFLGQEKRAQDAAGLSGWRVRCENEEDFVAEVTGRLRQVLDHLIEQKLADPVRIGALGTSRGGFVALHFAAADSRVKCVAGFAPVTDLAALSEFRGAQERPLVQRLALVRQADALAGRAIWLFIGDRDERVGTDQAIRFARQVTAASLARQRPALVDLLVLSEPKGHTVPAGLAEQAARWIERQMPPGQ